MKYRTLLLPPLHQVAETAEEDLLPHMDSIAGMLGAQCAEQIDEGQDMSESVSLEVSVNECG